jgi:predicted metal-dependent enzyme (double-stranded beta helix superfamily)/dihydrofolate reductase
MSQHESWHWTYEPVARKLKGMTATQTRPASRLSPLVAGIRTAVDSHADWAETAQLAADQLRRHLPTPDVLTAEQRLGSPDGYRSHTLHVEPDGSFSIVALVWRPRQFTRVHDHITWCAFGVIQGVEHEELFDADGNVIGRSDNHVGDVSGFAPPGDIHRVRNTADPTAISIHVYGTDVTRVGSSARRYYDDLDRDRKRKPIPPITEGAAAMSLARVHNFSISLDGFGTGEGQSADAHFGHAGDGLHEWMFATRWGREMLGQPGGSGGVDDAFSRLFAPGIGAEIMGAGKFGHPGWHEDPEWKGAWGPNPPFHTPVFVLTHHTRPSIEMEGGTTFHFIDASPAEALETAREAADGKDVRIGGGPTVIRDFLAAGLVDHLHTVVVPILLGRGVRLWDGLEGLEKDYEVEATASPSGVTHVTFTRAGV